MNIIVGTDASCDITVSSKYASSRHCLITDRAGVWWVEDLGSTNGTHVMRSGMMIRVPLGQYLKLVPGDVIRIGRVSLPPWDRS